MKAGGIAGAVGEFATVDEARARIQELIENTFKPAFTEEDLAELDRMNGADFVREALPGVPEPMLLNAELKFLNRLVGDLEIIRAALEQWSRKFGGCRTSLRGLTTVYSDTVRDPVYQSFRQEGGPLYPIGGEVSYGFVSCLAGCSAQAYMGTPEGLQNAFADWLESRGFSPLGGEGAERVARKGSGRTGHRDARRTARRGHELAGASHRGLGVRRFARTARAALRRGVGVR